MQAEVDVILAADRHACTALRLVTDLPGANGR